MTRVAPRARQLAAPVIGAASLFLAACAGPPTVRTTFLDSVDLVDMTDRMAMSLARDGEIASRTPASDPWVVSMNRVINHTNQIIPEREKWLYVGRLRAVLGATDFARERNIIWMMPPHRWAQVQDELGPPPPELRLTPTHELTAELTALTSTSGGGRSDTYLTEFQLIDLDTGSIVWQDHWEVKRAISGITYD